MELKTRPEKIVRTRFLAFHLIFHHYEKNYKKYPHKREDARYLRTWHSYEKVICKPAALATV